MSKAQTGELLCRHFPGEPSQTQIWLLNADTEGEFSLELRSEGGDFVRKKKVKIDRVSEARLLWSLSLPQGEFQVDMTGLTSPFFSCNTRTSCPSPNDFLASDLLLSLDNKMTPLEREPLSEVLDNEVDMLHYQVLYTQPQKKQLTIRAILYRKESNAQGETFTSLEQKAEVLTFTSGKASFQGSFRMAHLEAGTYLVEILAYEDDRIIPELERNQTLILQWSGLKDVFAEPNISLQKMKHITDPEWLDDALKKEKDLQKGILSEFWNKRNPNEPLLAMTTYFQRIQTAERLFKTWDCDQARTFVLYGRAIVNSFNKDKIDYERWSYDAEGLVFLFKKKEGIFVRL